MSKLPKVKKKLIDIDKFVKLAEKIRDADKIEKLEKHKSNMPLSFPDYVLSEVGDKLNEIIERINK